MPRPVVALITDFGSRDHYVGAMKGAILSYCPDAALVDIGHEIPAHDIEAAAWSLAAAFRSFPDGTVFAAVVDPGVGSSRRALVVECGGHFFVGPDNGIFTYILSENYDYRMREITNRALMRPQISATFHARDVFAPVAAFLARGGAFEEVGPPAHDPVLFKLESMRHAESGSGEWQASVVHVDHFGNLTTSLYERDLLGILAAVGNDPTEVIVLVGERQIPLVRAYADVAEGEACALVGSTGRLEVGVYLGSAADLLGAKRGTPVQIRLLRPVSR
jgi:S-adenosyl-L-methionine hydrolase (adenosine-forming)